MQTERPWNRKARLLIVDDHPVMRRGLTQLISELGNMEVCGEAASKKETLQAIADLVPDLAIIDISLGDDSGLDVVKAIKERFPNTRILVHSMHDEAVFAERVLAAGALGYVGKNETSETLIQAIRKVLAGEIHLSTRMTNRVIRRSVGVKETVAGETPLSLLSNREIQIFEMIGRGLVTKQIANRLHLSVKTIESHRENIKAKLRLTNATELTREAVRWVLENG
jgi:DNA-binding NarL/FixJ family response regulator